MPNPVEEEWRWAPFDEASGQVLNYRRWPWRALVVKFYDTGDGKPWRVYMSEDPSLRMRLAGNFRVDSFAQRTDAEAYARGYHLATGIPRLYAEPAWGPSWGPTAA